KNRNISNRRSLLMDIIEVCRKLYQKNFLAGIDGNVSVYNQKNKTISITPSGVPKNCLNEEDLCSMSPEGAPLKGNPSSEKSMHLTVYREQKKARAVVHAHPPFAVSLSLSRPRWKTLPSVLSETVIALGEIPIIPYACPGTEEMAQSLCPFLQTSRALILSRHGAVTWGEDLQSAYLTMECLEHSAQIIYLAETLGGSRLLNEKDLKQLLNLHSSFTFKNKNTSSV
ncbi:MAG: class II aldolase/adducin family protein, partial [Bdellovibrionales bacterium]|nr:class II aldolase/adducin family protein [Bdellovibrionales bacterium]